MMTRRRADGGAWVVAAVVAAIVAGGCVEYKHSGPTSASELLQQFTGTWKSTATAGGGIDPATCGDFQWEITDRTSNSASGTFSATCAGSIKLTGSAQGTLSGTTVNWTASGNASGLAGLSCPFSLAGTAVPEGIDGIRVNYSGSTCLGPISGSELLKKP